MFDRRELGPESGRMLEDALRAGVMDELLSPDEPLLHGNFAPGAEAVGEFVGDLGWGVHGGAHCHRGVRILSTDGRAEKKFPRRP